MAAVHFRHTRTLGKSQGRELANKRGLKSECWKRHACYNWLTTHRSTARNHWHLKHIVLDIESSPRTRAHFRANLIAASLASVPVFAKNTLSAKELSTSFFANLTCNRDSPMYFNSTKPALIWQQFGGQDIPVPQFTSPTVLQRHTAKFETIPFTG